MPRLSPSELRARLAFDYRAVFGLSRETLGAVSGYASLSDISRRQEVTTGEGVSGAAATYLVEYRLSHLIGRGQTAASATAVFDLGAGGNYPFTPPAIAFVSRPLPWSPHVHPGSGTVCIGSGWAASGGRMLLAQLIVHVMRLMNFDEPRTTPENHWNASADAYWESVLGRRPYLPELRYPRLPAEITHGLGGDASEAFRASGDGFSTVGGNEGEGAGMFRRIEG